MDVYFPMKWGAFFRSLSNETSKITGRIATELAPWREGSLPGSLPMELPTLTHQGSASPRHGSSPIAASPKTSPKETTKTNQGPGGEVRRSWNRGKSKGGKNPTPKCHSKSLYMYLWLYLFIFFWGDFCGIGGGGGRPFRFPWKGWSWVKSRGGLPHQDGCVRAKWGWKPLKFEGVRKGWCIM